MPQKSPAVAQEHEQIVVEIIGEDQQVLLEYSVHPPVLGGDEQPPSQATQKAHSRGDARPMGYLVTGFFVCVAYDVVLICAYVT